MVAATESPRDLMTARFATVTQAMSPRATRSGTGRLASVRQRYASTLSSVRGSETAKASWLAIAMMANNVIALGSTVVFARLISDYGSLAALVSYFLILAVAGYAMQVATAREGVLGHLGVGAGLAATVRSWTRSILVFTAVMSVVSVLLRQPIADAVGVRHDAWAAALGIPAGCLYLLLTILRGVLQGAGDYRTVGISLIGEQTVRLIIGAALALAGLGVTGAYLGTPLSFVAMSLYCLVVIRKQVGLPVPGQGPALSLWLHVKRAWAPIAALAVIAVLQNIDIIVAKHRFSTALASSYGATAVAAKVVIWVAMGAGFYLVPEVRRRADGEDTRPVLARALIIIAVVAVPCLLIFAVAPHLLLKLAFGRKRLGAYNSLFLLGLAFTMLAATYLAIQYMLALKRFWFLIVLAAVAVGEPVLLLHASQKPAGFAAVVLAVQAVGALLAFAIALRPGHTPPDRSDQSPDPAAATGTPEAAMSPELV